MFVLFEIVVFRLGKVSGESPAAVRSRHTNLDRGIRFRCLFFYLILNKTFFEFDSIKY